MIIARKPLLVSLSRIDLGDFSLTHVGEPLHKQAEERLDTAFPCFGQTDIACALEVNTPCQSPGDGIEACGITGNKM